MGRTLPYFAVGPAVVQPFVPRKVGQGGEQQQIVHGNDGTWRLPLRREQVREEDRVQAAFQRQTAQTGLLEDDTQGAALRVRAAHHDPHGGRKRFSPETLMAPGHEHRVAIRCPRRQGLREANRDPDGTRAGAVNA